MCVVSMILDHGRDRWPPQAFPVWPPQPNTAPQLPQQPTTDPRAAKERQAILDFMELVEAAKKFDASAGEPDCEDPEKAKFLDRLAERLTAIEQRLGIDGADGADGAEPKA